MEKYNRLHESTPDLPNTEKTEEGSPGKTEEGFTERYEEFFPSTIPCHSCRGNGRIPKALEKNVVVIPLNDKRLKPKRTALYIGISFFICVVLLAMVTFFLTPRNIEMEGNEGTYYPIIYNEDNKTLYFSLTAGYIFKNWNYIPISITQLNVYVEFDIYQGGYALNSTKQVVHLRNFCNHYVELNITFKGTPLDYPIYKFCQKKRMGYFRMNFRANATAQYLGRTEEISYLSYPKIQCRDPTMYVN